MAVAGKSQEHTSSSWPIVLGHRREGAAGPGDNGFWRQTGFCNCIKLERV